MCRVLDRGFTDLHDEGPYHLLGLTVVLVFQSHEYLKGSIVDRTLLGDVLQATLKQDD